MCVLLHVHSQWQERVSERRLSVKSPLDLHICACTLVPSVMRIITEVFRLRCHTVGYSSRAAARQISLEATKLRRQLARRRPSAPQRQQCGAVADTHPSASHRKVVCLRPRRGDKMAATLSRQICLLVSCSILLLQGKQHLGPRTDRSQTFTQTPCRRSCRRHLRYRCCLVRVSAHTARMCLLFSDMPIPC